MNLLSQLINMNENAELMDATITKLGLTDAFQNLPSDTIHNATNRCLDCTHLVDCAHWLAIPERPTEAPDFCGNHDLFATLEPTVAA
jgi:hypothetical protein